jgi:membrane-associated phospholipid phosphatase
LKKFIILIFTFYTIGFSQSNFVKKDSANIGNKLWSDIKLSFNDNLEFFSRPAEFNSTNWFTLAGITATTGLLMTVDKEVKNTVVKNQTKFQNNFTKFGKYYGELYPLVALSVGVYGGGLVFGNEELRTTGRILIESLAAAGITTTVLKVVLGRSRPYLNKGEFNFNLFDIKNENNSLPSGHTTVAFTISTVLAKRIDNVYASIALYGLASLTAYQRIYSNNHWISDTFLGAAIGYSAGSYFSNLEEERNEKNKSKVSYKLFPNINSSGYGISFLLRF